MRSPSRRRRFAGPSNRTTNSPSSRRRYSCRPTLTSTHRPRNPKTWHCLCAKPGEARRSRRRGQALAVADVSEKEGMPVRRTPPGHDSCGATPLCSRDVMQAGVAAGLPAQTGGGPGYLQSGGKSWHEVSAEPPHWELVCRASRRNSQGWIISTAIACQTLRGWSTMKPAGRHDFRRCTHTSLVCPSCQTDVLRGAWPD